jgi:CCR4-NOT complex subunit CAF16
MNLVEIEDLNFDFFGENILFNVDLEVKENERILLVGSNGAGKSTLLRLIAGIHLVRNYKKFSVMGKLVPNEQSSGLAYLGNRWIRNNSFAASSPYMADIAAGEMLKDWQKKHIERRDELVDILEIDLTWRMHQVSDGQRKRVQIMLALLQPFKLLIIDEFLNELDVVVRDKFFNYLDKECNQRNGSIIYATHIFDNIHQWMNKVIYISGGRCEKKINMKEFNTSETLFDSVKNKLICDRNREVDKAINFEQKNSHTGFGSGRSKYF